MSGASGGLIIFLWESIWSQPKGKAGKKQVFSTQFWCFLCSSVQQHQQKISFLLWMLSCNIDTLPRYVLPKCFSIVDRINLSSDIILFVLFQYFPLTNILAISFSICKAQRGGIKSSRPSLCSHEFKRIQPRKLL